VTVELDLDRRASATAPGVPAGGVLDAMADPVVVIGPQTELLYGNRAASERYGAPLASLLGTPLHTLIHPGDLDTALLSLESVATKEVGTLVEIRISDHTGEWSWFEVRGRAWPEGPPGSIVLNMRESTERRQWEISQGDAEMMGAILDHLPVVGMLLAADGTLRGANRALTRALRRPLEGVRGRLLTDLVAPDEADGVERALAAAARGPGPTHLEAHHVRADGIEVPMSLTFVDLLDDRAVQGVVVTATDISPLVAARRELHRLAATDDLTGLPNRTSLRQHLQALQAEGPGVTHSILFGDVDGLKAVNDRHGHRAGDAALVAVAERLRAATRATTDVVARLSGDEFVVVVPTTDPIELARLRERIDAVMAEAIVLPSGPVVTLSISVGASALKPTVDVDQLLHEADAAMYRAKRDRRR
jgi:diguanylate cyclase (GGDEF)-like protein/PAS domain S-box-containing protein